MIIYSQFVSLLQLAGAAAAWKLPVTPDN